ncbi:hybrid sensor histidine kinase/response regulator transcription factor [Flammeovirga kamogawensis]|uniref:histidine kinase n=1 Tax=Flammeovirga kamogawensis TaxID=373891 RepID=A0ABX8H2E3_9BACT|nr:ATP-binding protein [Flammeovirga kamogawensis]MBB6460264.1 signal transduction histidine kinase/DNA-binding response OmpR family regulator [Flammeovirga kamogawensis]QWG10075.1 response regulator [Flammeovirga kamogawensis]
MLFILCGNTTLLAQISGFEVDISKQLTIENGLSHFGVTSIAQDNNGLLWVGTFKGLNIFDGYEFKTFYHSTDSGLVSNRIHSLYKDENNNILIGTEKGVSVYLYQKQQFKVLYTNKNTIGEELGPYINKIIETHDYIICNTLKKGVILINKSDYSFHSIILPNFINIGSFKSFNIDKIDNDNILLATNSGIIKATLSTGKCRRILEGDFPFCLDIAFDGNSTIYALNYRFLGIISIKNDNYNLKAIAFSGEDYSQIELGENGELWLMKNNNDLAVIGNPTYVKNIDKQVVKFSFTSEFTRLSSILLTEDGGWIGSFNQGLFKFRSEERPFKYSNLKNNGQVVNTSSQVVSMITLDHEQVMITLNANNAKVFNINNNSIKEVKQPGVYNQVITRVLKDTYGTIWGGSLRVGVFQKKNLVVPWKQLMSPEYPILNDESVRGFSQDKYGDIWVAGLRKLYRFSMHSNGKIKEIEVIRNLGNVPYNYNLATKVIYADPKQDCIWLGTQSDGLFRINYSHNKPLTEATFQHFIPIKNDTTSLPVYAINCMQRVPNGDLWLGTLEGGITKVIEENGLIKFKTFTENDGLDDNDVMTFQYDNKGRLWIATNQGINQFDPETENFRNYTTEDGLVPASFEVSSTKLLNGMMVFGGNNGICYFNPDLVPNESNIPPLLFGDLKVHNQIVRVKSKDNKEAILYKPLNDSDEITLEYNQRSISIELISLHYSNTEAHHIRYRLLPKDNSWLEVTSNNKIVNFSLLPPGEYTFEAQVSNSKNEWSPTKRIKIHVKYAWWNSNGAKGLYFILIFLVIAMVMLTLLRMKTLEYNLQIEQFDKNRLEELDAARLKLFMNISHEFRTPLTLISGPISVLKGMFETNQDAFQHIDLIQRQSKKMFQLVEQVHDVRKADENILKLKYTTFDFTDLVTDVKQDFDKLAEDSNKKLILEGEANKLFVLADEHKLEVVVNNLLNNAFKFTRKGDTISITYNVRKGGLYLSVSDTGIGIPEEDLAHLFKRFYQSSKGEKYSVGTGIGLELTKMLVEMHQGEIKVSSILGEGTKFEVFLPLEIRKEDVLSEKRIDEILSLESHDERQRVEDQVIDLSEIIQENEHSDVTIYYVEDNTDLRNFITKILNQYFAVVTFSNGKECMDALESEWPDLILSDIIMPEMNGIELCKQIKSNPKTNHIPVVLLTSRSSTEEKIEGLEVGADMYITKPFEVKHLIATFKNILNNRKTLQTKFQVEAPMPLKKKQKTEEDKIFVNKFYKLLEENLTNENIDLEEFAKELYMSRSQFFRKVKAISDTTPQDLIRSYKLKKAAELLCEGQYSVADVVVMVGFKSRTHFSKSFKEIYGITPSKYAVAKKVE